MSNRPVQKLTVEQYLALERSSEAKHQYFLGEVFAMGGASRAHNRITSNIGAILNHQFRTRACEEFVSDMRVKVADSGLYTYPDIAATCHDPEFDDQRLDTLVNPQVIFEVLSESTESYDRGQKFKLYRKISSLSDYILVAQDRISVEQFTRLDDGSWRLRPYDSLSDVLRIDSIEVELRLEDVYRKVELGPEKIA